MPAFVDWNSLLFGSSPEIQPRPPVQVASHSEPEPAPAPAPELERGLADAPAPESPAPLDVLPESVLPKGALSGERRSVVPEVVSPESGILQGAALGTLAPEGTLLHRVIHWRAVLENPNDQFTIGAVILGTAFLWLLFGRRKRNHASSRRLADGEDLSVVKKDFAERTEALEKQLGQALKKQAEALEVRFQQVLIEQSNAIEEEVRKSLNKRVETLEVRIKLDQEALEDVHRALSERLEAFEGYVQTIDAKQLDQEANSIAQLTLSQRLDTVEENFRNVENKARSSAQRIEAIDDSVRVIDSRAKALSQRVEAAEDNLNTTDAQVTLLSHDVNRGSSVIEKLQRQVKMLPDSEKFKGLSRTWEAKVKKLETKLDETHSALEEHLAEPPPSLTWSQIEFVEIEPSGPLYARPHSLSFDESIASPSSSSVRSHSTNGRTYSTVSSSPAFPPMTPERKRIDTAGFRETTFSSRQKLLAYRAESWSG
ncbi:hypothetical protein F5Y14DRAFT_93984 [Nemania sp. NC0429]|nr:hypothetical protein F5Y14DRAFT_93984 [Nemania sp. NC0429]